MSQRAGLFRWFTITGIVLGLLFPRAVQAARGIIYVRQSASGANSGVSWADAYTDLQPALKAAVAGDQIWVAEGIYRPTSGTDRRISFGLEKGVKLYGGFGGDESRLEERNWRDHATILSGDIGVIGEKGDNSYHVVSVQDDSTATNVLDGFTIRDGNANYRSGIVDGGGIYIVYGSSMLANLNIIDNSSNRYGGGLYVFFGQATLVNVSFRGNSAESGGGALFQEGNSTLINVSFIANSALKYGGGMYHNNATLVNVSFVGNTSMIWGGGLYNAGSTTMLVNVNLVANSALIGGGMRNYYDNPTIVNSIIWGNTGGAISNSDDSDPTVQNSIVQGGYPGAGNLDDDPRFLRSPAPGADGIWNTSDDDYGDLRLQGSSAAVDAGDSAMLPQDTIDLDGDGDTGESLPYDLNWDPRIHGAAVDIGVYESRLYAQTITFQALENKAFNDPDFDLNATATSGLPVSFLIAGNCTLVDADTVHLEGVGSCSITAFQDGDAMYAPAPPVEHSFLIAKGNAVLSLGNLSQTYDGSVKVVTVTTIPRDLSGTGITYDGSTAAPINAGSYWVVASLTHDYYQAMDATGTLVISQADQTISFEPLADKTVDDEDFELTASASSNLTVEFAASGPCQILQPRTVHLTGEGGRCTITASQPGDLNFKPAPAVARSFTVFNNFAPQVEAIADQQVDEQATLSLLVEANDALDTPPNPLNFTLTQAPAGAMLNQSSGEFSWSPSEEQGPGIYPVSIRVGDDGIPERFSEVHFNILVRAVNDLSLTIQADANPALSGTTLHYTLSASNPAVDPGSDLVFRVNLPAGLSFNSSQSDAGCRAEGAAVICRASEIDAYSTLNMVLAADVGMGMVDDALLELSASLSAAQSDPRVENNTAQISLPVRYELVIYELDLQAPGPHWSDTDITTSPSGEDFLGLFNNEEVRLSFTDLAQHGQVVVGFDLYVVGTWDGNQELLTADGSPEVIANGSLIGPDLWEFGVQESTLVHSSFSNWQKYRQAYPQSHPAGDFEAFCGALRHGVLGYVYEGLDGMDAVYRFRFVIDDSKPTLVLRFRDLGLQGLSDEAWGLGNVKVSLRGSRQAQYHLFMPVTTIPR